MTASETVMGYYTLTQCMAGAGTVTLWGGASITTGVATGVSRRVQHEG
ncbi:MAG: hypothetical protein ABS956_15080 [Pseudomonas sp.]